MAYTNKAGQELEPGKWYNFGGKVSWRFIPWGRHGKRFQVRHDEKERVVTAGGPAARDAIEGALYRSADCLGYAAYCFGGSNV